MEELEKKAWKEALLYAFDQADKNTWDNNQNYRDYAILNKNKLYPNKIIYKYSIEYLKKKYRDLYNKEIKIKTGVGKEMNSYLASKGAKDIVLNKSKNDLLRFKNLLEYFVAHLEWVVKENSSNSGYLRYIKPLIDSNNFKKTGQGYAGAKIQDQIKEWQSYDSGEISINIQANYGDYKTVKCYLNWKGTGINIVAKWKEDKIVSLYQDEFIYWEEPTRRVNLEVEFSLRELGLFDSDQIGNNLIAFYDSYVRTLKKRKDLDKQNELMKNILQIKKILEYKKQIILQGPPGTGKTREAKLIAKEVIGVNDLKDNEQFKLIQFHPSYTYEDFVRGIVSKPNEEGDGVIYDAENKILAEFANKALDNFLEANIKDEIITSKSSIFDAFIESIKDELAQSEHHKYDITEAVYLFSADENRFKYKGDNWVAHSKGLNMKFSELKKIIDSGAIERQDIKKMSDVEELTRQHATYFIKIVEKYYDFKKTFKESVPTQSKTELKNYVLIIDEINRANLSSVLGELIYALEYRGEEVESMYEVNGEKKLILPPNLYIIGTMNTADRSVGHIDYAIRRRFAFVDVLPEYLTDDEFINFDGKLYNSVKALFTSDEYKTRSNYLSNEFDPKDVALGHSYFIDKSDEGGSMDIRLEYEIKPILFEYIKDGVLIGDNIVEIIEKLEANI